jgi:hypothetical protein
VSTPTDFAGLYRVAPGESPWDNGGAFYGRNIETIDRLLRIAAKTHRHDGHAPVANPPGAPSVAMQGTGGNIPSGSDVYVGITAIDVDGGETAIGPLTHVIAPASSSAYPATPTGTADYSAGDLTANTYLYAITSTDGAGGESVPSDPFVITLEGGHANGRVVLSGLQSHVVAMGGTGWRLYRSTNNSDYGFLAAGATEGYVDDCTHCADPQLTPPDDTDDATAGTSSAVATVQASDLPVGAVAFRVYAGNAPTLLSPSFVGQYELSAVETPITISGLVLQQGSPPPVSLSVGGASLIQWREPVATVGALPMTGNTTGDVRLALTTLLLYAWDGDSWAIISGGGGGGSGGGGTFSGWTDIPLTGGATAWTGDASQPDPAVPQWALVGPLVMLRGVIAADEDNDRSWEVLGNLPSAARPDQDQLFTALGEAGLETAVSVSVAVKTNGELQVAAGAGLRITLDGTIYISADALGVGLPGSGAAYTIKDETTTLPARGALAFVGAGVTATDDAAGDRTVVTIPGGGSGGGLDWQGAWDAGTDYPVGAVVRYANGLWIAQGDPGVGQVPGEAIVTGGGGAGAAPVWPDNVSPTPTATPQFIAAGTKNGALAPGDGTVEWMDGNSNPHDVYVIDLPAGYAGTVSVTPSMAGASLAILTQIPDGGGNYPTSRGLNYQRTQSLAAGDPYGFSLAGSTPRRWWLLIDAPTNGAYTITVDDAGGPAAIDHSGGGTSEPSRWELMLQA